MHPSPKATSATDKGGHLLPFVVRYLAASSGSVTGPDPSGPLRDTREIAYRLRLWKGKGEVSGTAREGVRPITEEEEQAVLAGLSDRTKLIVAGWVFRTLYHGWLGGGRTYRGLLEDLGFPSDELTDGEHAYRYLLNTALEVNNLLPDRPAPEAPHQDGDES